MGARFIFHLRASAENRVVNRQKRNTVRKEQERNVSSFASANEFSRRLKMHLADAENDARGRAFLNSRRKHGRRSTPDKRASERADELVAPQMRSRIDLLSSVHPRHLTRCAVIRQHHWIELQIAVAQQIAEHDIELRRSLTLLSHVVSSYKNSELFWE